MSGENNCPHFKVAGILYVLCAITSKQSLKDSGIRVGWYSQYGAAKIATAKSSTVDAKIATAKSSTVDNCWRIKSGNYKPRLTSPGSWPSALLCIQSTL